MTPDPTPPGGTPKTIQEVNDLVATVSPPEEVNSLFKSIRPVRAREPKLWFAIGVCLFLAVILLSQIQAISERSSLKGQLRENAVEAECRAVITGDLNIAKAEGILAGNNAILLLLNVLHDVVSRVPVNDEQFQTDTANITAADKAAAAHAQVAIENQRNVLELCRER